MPAPPPESEPAIVSARGRGGDRCVIGSGPNRSGSSGRSVPSAPDRREASPSTMRPISVRVTPNASVSSDPRRLDRPGIGKRRPAARSPRRHRARRRSWRRSATGTSSIDERAPTPLGSRQSREVDREPVRDVDHGGGAVRASTPPSPTRAAGRRWRRTKRELPRVRHRPARCVSRKPAALPPSSPVTTNRSPGRAPDRSTALPRRDLARHRHRDRDLPSAGQVSTDEP